MSAATRAGVRRHNSLLASSLRAAPELASLSILEHAIHVLLSALAAEHTTLADPAGPHEPPSLRAARRLSLHASALLTILGRYRATVDTEIAEAPPSLTDDLPY